MRVGATVDPCIEARRFFHLFDYDGVITRIGDDLSCGEL